MSTELHEPSSGIASLVGGIVDDAEHLLHQQVDLVKQEVRKELKQAKRAAVSAMIGLWIVGMGILVLLIAAAQALAAHSTIPSWGCYGLVGGVTALIGGCLLLVAKKTASHVELLPPPETAGAIKENYQWMTGKRKT